MSVNNSLYCGPVEKYGTQEQKVSSHPLPILTHPSFTSIEPTTLLT